MTANSTGYTTAPPFWPCTARARPERAEYHTDTAAHGVLNTQNGRLQPTFGAWRTLQVQYVRTSRPQVPARPDVAVLLALWPAQPAHAAARGECGGDVGRACMLRRRTRTARIILRAPARTCPNRKRRSREVSFKLLCCCAPASRPPCSMSAARSRVERLRLVSRVHEQVTAAAAANGTKSVARYGGGQGRSACARMRGVGPSRPSALVLTAHSKE